MATTFKVEELKSLMEAKYPDPADPDDDEHPMTAVGVLLLAAAFMDTVDANRLRRFTSYSREFISAVSFNMRNNRLWVDNQYDCSDWLTEDGTVDDYGLWNHIDAACGNLWMPDCDTSISIDPCRIYWDDAEHNQRWKPKAAS